MSDLDEASDTDGIWQLIVSFFPLFHWFYSALQFHWAATTMNLRADLQDAVAIITRLKNDNDTARENFAKVLLSSFRFSFTSLKAENKIRYCPERVWSIKRKVCKCNGSKSLKNFTPKKSQTFPQKQTEKNWCCPQRRHQSIGAETGSMHERKCRVERINLVRKVLSPLSSLILPYCLFTKQGSWKIENVYSFWSWRTIQASNWTP